MFISRDISILLYMNFLKEKAVYKDIGKTLDFTFKICGVFTLNYTL